MPLRLTSKHYF